MKPYSYKFIHKRLNGLIKLKDIKYICNQLKRGNIDKATKVATRNNIKINLFIKGIYLDHSIMNKFHYYYRTGYGIKCALCK